MTPRDIYFDRMMTAYEKKRKPSARKKGLADRPAKKSKAKRKGS